MRLSHWNAALWAVLMASQVHAGQEVGDSSGLPQDFVDVWAKRDGHWQVIFTQINNAS